MDRCEDWITKNKIKSIKEFDEAGLRRITEFNIHGDMVSDMMIHDNVTVSTLTHEYQYDEKQRLVRSSLSLNFQTTYAYDDDDNCVLESYSDGYATCYSYDENKRCISRVTTDPRMPSCKYTYDEHGRLVNTIFPSGVSTREYDGDKLIKVSLNGVTIETYKYDERGNKIYHHDHDEGDETSYEYDENNNCIHVKESEPGYEIWYKFNDRGLKTDTTSSTGKHLRYEYEFHEEV